MNKRGPCTATSQLGSHPGLTETLCILSPSRTAARNSNTSGTCCDLDAVPRPRGDATIGPRFRAAYRSTQAGDDVDDVVFLGPEHWHFPSFARRAH